MVTHEQILNKLKSIHQQHSHVSILVATNMTEEPISLYQSTKQRNSDEILYEIGSSSKMFTACSILLLQERGLLQLDDSIGHYLDDDTKALLMVNNFDYSQVSLSQVLSHTSGLGEHLNSGDDLETFDRLQGNKTYRFDELMLLAKQNTLLSFFTPGEKFQYSNIGYILLGKVIETVSKMNYQQFIDKNILKPFHLQHTFFISNHLKQNDAFIKNNLLQGHFNGQVTQMDGSLASSAGEMISCLRDMQRFLLALHNQQLLSIESFELLMASIHNSIDSGLHYGLGMYQLDGLFGHAGQTFGFLSSAFYRIEDEKYLLLATNDSLMKEPLAELKQLILEN